MSTPVSWSSPGVPVQGWKFSQKDGGARKNRLHGIHDGIPNGTKKEKQDGEDTSVRHPPRSNVSLLSCS